MENNNSSKNNNEEIATSELSHDEQIKNNVKIFLETNEIYIDENVIGIEIDGVKVPFFEIAKNIEKEVAEGILYRACVLLEEISLERDPSSTFIEMLPILKEEITRPLFSPMKKIEIDHLIDLERITSKGVLVWAVPVENIARIIDKETINGLFKSEFVRDASHVVEKLIKKNVERAKKFKSGLAMLDEAPLRIEFRDKSFVILDPKLKYEQRLIYVMYALYRGGWVGAENATENRSADLVEKLNELDESYGSQTLSEYLTDGTHKKRDNWNAIKNKFIHKTFDLNKIFLNPLISLD